MDEFLLFLGRFHPLLVHVPIGLVIGLLAAEAWSVVGADRSQRPCEGLLRLFYLLVATAAGAAAVTGYLLARRGGYQGPLFTSHWRFALAFAVVCVAGAVLALAPAGLLKHLPGGAAVRRVVLLAAAALMTVAGHRGGQLTHGERFLSAHAPTWLKPLLGPADSPGTEETVYTAMIRPIFERRCLKCHGGSQAPKGVDLHSPESLLAETPVGQVVIPGQADASRVVQVIELPLDEQPHMPPPGNPQPTAAERQALRWWIEQGASFSAPVSLETIPAPLRPLLEQGERPAPEQGQGHVGLVPPDAKAVAALRVRGIFIQRLDETSSDLQVDFSHEAASVDGAAMAQLQLLAPHVRWLDLSRCALSSEVLATVAGMPHLTRLNLSGASVGDAAIPSLRQLRELRRLNLCQTQVTDAAAADLSRLIGLEELYLWGSEVTAAGLERLRQALPDTEVVGDVRGDGPKSPISK